MRRLPRAGGSSSWKPLDALRRWDASIFGQQACGLLFAAAALSLCGLAAGGCGDSAAGTARSTPSVPAYVEAPVTHEQQLVDTGARLILADKCSACHLTSAGRGIAPAFESLAGHRVTLTDGRSVTVDERQIAEALRAPSSIAIKGYDAALMVHALKRLRLTGGDIAALGAFIEQIGPE